LSETLATQIRAIVKEASECAAFRIPFKDFIFGKWIRYSGWQGNFHVGLIRMFRREAVTWRDEVHPSP